ncbi:MAG: tetratricopeptide repeat protein [Planctomycetes bacterium]|nr:tetratricopeptide repeat protein [Planctomycetota bacterium]
MKPTISHTAAALLLCASALCGCHREPQTPEALARAGMEMHRSHDFAKAIDYYRRSLALHPDTSVRVNLARALFAAGKAPEAAAEYKALLQDDSSNGALWFDYGLVLENGIKDLSAAEEALFNATKYPPKPPEASYHLGNVLMARGRYEEAGACFDAAISFAPPKASWLDDAHEKQIQAYLLAKEHPKPEEAPAPK